MQERRFSAKAERVLRSAQAAALELGHGYVGCEHLLLGMLREEEDAPGRALRALGVTDVFDAGKADFSPLTDKADAIFLSQAKHSARVTIDEEGVVAAAYTVMVACGAALPPDERVEFTLDRPFLFAVTGESGEILFAGIVNTPA